MLSLEEYLSPGAGRVVSAARRRASRRGAQYVEPLDLLAGLISDEDFESVRLLTEHGFRAEQPWDHVADAAADLDDDRTAIVLNAESRRVMGRARELSLGMAARTEVGTEDLLVALLQVWDEAKPMLEAHGLRVAALESAYHRPLSDRSAPIKSELPPLALDLDVEVVPRSRLVDANLNRASEGFRVAEDYTRFVLGDRGLTERLKQARHELQRAASFLPESWRIASRDVSNDVGAELATEREGRRETMFAVAVANIKRVQEALRSLEEASKIDNSLAARQFGALRYEAYQLEKQLRQTSVARQVLASADVYWLGEPDACRKTFEWIAKEVMDAGVVLIQLRQKEVDDRTLFRQATDLRRWTEPFAARLIINDRADVARLVGADGVHVGQEDLPPAELRKVVGPQAIVGVSTHTIAQVEAAFRAGADYIGVGPVFPSRTKTFAAFPGLEFVRAVAQATSVPAFCIGGITSANVHEVVEAGGRRVAVGRAISDSVEPAQVVRRLRTALAVD